MPSGRRRSCRRSRSGAECREPAHRRGRRPVHDRGLRARTRTRRPRRPGPRPGRSLRGGPRSSGRSRGRPRRPGTGGAVKALEDSEELVRESHVEAGPVVSHEPEDPVPVIPAPDLDDRLLASRAELQGVREEVREYLTEEHGVSFGLRQLRHPEVDPLTLLGRRELGEGGRREAAHVEPGPCEVSPPCARELEEPVDERGHVQDVGPDLREVLAALLDGRLEAGVLEQRGIAVDRAEGRREVVGDGVREGRALARFADSSSTVLRRTRSSSRNSATSPPARRGRGRRPRSPAARPSSRASEKGPRCTPAESPSRPALRPAPPAPSRPGARRSSRERLGRGPRPASASRGSGRHRAEGEASS